VTSHVIVSQAGTVEEVPSMRVQEVADGVHVSENGGLVNWVLVVVADDGLLALDAGLRTAWEDLVGLCARLGRDPRELRAVLLTHGHVDHTASRGGGRNGSAPRCTCIRRTFACSSIRSSARGRNARRCSTSATPRPGGPLTLCAVAVGCARRFPRNTVALVSGATLPLPGSPVVLATPGHTATPARHNGAVEPLATLGLGASASPKEVAGAYRRLAKRWHPDRAGEGPEAARRMAEINAAYALLRDGVAGERARPAPAPSAAPAPARPRPRPGHWLAESVRRSLGAELLGALQEGEEVELVTPAATWKSPRALLAVTDRRLLWLLDDAISHRVHSLKWRDIVRVEHRLRRPLRRTAVLRVETKLGRRLEWAELRPETAAAVARHVVAGAGLKPAA